MKRRKLTSAFFVATYLLLTWLKWETIEASVLSLLTSTILMMKSWSVDLYGSVDLLEYWIAAVAWFVLGVWLLLRMRVSANKNSWQSNTSVASIFLSTVFILALTAPIVVPVPPHVQGDLMTTRLLPPLSLGFINERNPNEIVQADDGALEQQRRRANTFLLHRSFHITTQAHGESMLFLFGTDDSARDVFSRVLVGARISLTIGIAAAIGSLIIGAFVGFIAGYSNRFTDSLLMRMTDLFLAIPSLFLVIGIMAFLGQSVAALIAILATTGWMGIARTVRTEVQKLREREFILAAQLLNQTKARIFVRHLLPNLKPMLQTAVLLQFGNAVLAEASLGFLGLGIQPPTASWGNMLGQSLGYIRHGWWLAVFPGIALTSVLIAIQQIADSRGATR